jgi:hypothetical protein
MARQKVPVRTQAKSKPAPDGASDRRATKNRCSRAVVIEVATVRNRATGPVCYRHSVRQNSTEK